MANLGEGEYGEFGDYGEGYLSQADAGSGAYTVKSHNKQDITVMTRFDNYFPPFPENAPDEVRMRYGLEDATLRAMMSRGEHDVSSMWHPFPVYSARRARWHQRRHGASGRRLLREDQHPTAADR